MSRPTKSIQTYRQYNLSKPKTPDYENLEEGDYLLIPAEKFVSPKYIGISGNTQFADLVSPKKLRPLHKSRDPMIHDFAGVMRWILKTANFRRTISTSFRRYELFLENRIIS